MDEKEIPDEPAVEEENSKEFVDEKDIPKEFIEENDADLDEQIAQSMYNRLTNLNVGDKIKLATYGNREARGLLIKEAHTAVVTAVLNNPRVTEDEAIAFAGNRNLNKEVTRLIASKTIAGLPLSMQPSSRLSGGRAFSYGCEQTSGGAS